MELNKCKTLGHLGLPKSCETFKNFRRTEMWISNTYMLLETNVPGLCRLIKSIFHFTCLSMWHPFCHSHSISETSLQQLWKIFIIAWICVSTKDFYIAELEWFDNN